MDKDVSKAYDELVPQDQLVIDAMIVTLYKKDQEIRNLVAGLLRRVEQESEARGA